MTTMQQPHYWFGGHVALAYDETVAQVTAALKDQGFSILTEIDVRQTLKAKLDVDRRPYVILGACNPPLAHRALEAEPLIGVLLPCNVIVYEDDGGTMVAAMDPAVALGLVDNPDLAAVAKEAQTRLRQALATLPATE